MYYVLDIMYYVLDIMYIKFISYNKKLKKN